MADKISYHRYVNVSIVPDYERAGWVVSPDMSKSALHAPHGAYGAIIMDWAGIGEPVEPPKQLDPIGGDL